MKGYTQLLKGTGTHKFKMVFYDMMRKKIKTIQFGALGYEDYTTHQDMNRQQAYLSRHSQEDWGDPQTAGSLSRWILWSKPNLSAGYKAYRQRFGLQLY